MQLVWLLSNKPISQCHLSTQVAVDDFQTHESQCCDLDLAVDVSEDAQRLP
jgi:hypothetical protein